MTGSEIVLSLEVQNSFAYPKQAGLLTAELAAMTTRLEEDPNYSEEDELLAHAFQGEYHSYDQFPAKAWVSEKVADISKDFPDLVFALDIKDDSLDENPRILRREYYIDGKRQIVKPYEVIPDFDPEGDLESI